MRKIIILTTLLLLALLFSCSGDDSPEKDKIPPTTPKLISHLGDTGDDPIIVNGVTISLNDDNNGIDTVPDGNWIKVPWEKFVDNDLSHVKVYRYSESDPEPKLINTVPASEDYYLDQSSLVEREWYYYYIELYDASGNFSVSDTVSYAILAKSILSSPVEGETINQDTAKLCWERGDSQTNKFRILLWDNQTGDLVFSYPYYYTPNEEFPSPPEFPFPRLNPRPPSGQVFRWRIDAFDDDPEHNLEMGSESKERTLIIQ